MEELLDFLCGDKDYCIIRCKQFTRRELREMFTKEETMRKDFENMCGNYWYAIRCWESKSTPFPQEFEKLEAYCKEIIKKYNFQ